MDHSKSQFIVVKGLSKKLLAGSKTLRVQAVRLRSTFFLCFGLDNDGLSFSLDYERVSLMVHQIPFLLREDRLVGYFSYKLSPQEIYDVKFILNYGTSHSLLSHVVHISHVVEQMNFQRFSFIYDVIQACIVFVSFLNFEN